jgi:SAM-dependent methyltransferase
MNSRFASPHTSDTSQPNYALDDKTLLAYNSLAATFARDWHEQPSATDLHDIIRRFFLPGLTADIGCGAGREVAWLCSNGFPAVGYDASAGLLAQSRARYPRLQFHYAALPALEGIVDRSFANVLCETVIMHLAQAAIAPAIRRLLAILQPGGILYLSWRVTTDADLRDTYGRLYGSFEADLVRSVLAGAQVLLDEEVVSASSDKLVHRCVVRQPPTPLCGEEGCRPRISGRSPTGE